MPKKEIRQTEQEQNWLKSAVVYQIYPRSFKDSDGDGVGDLQGVIDKLDYLNDGTKNSLGVTAIWLSPVYVSPMRDLGYDVADHTNIDPLFGDLKTFDWLVKEAHKRGIKVIMDFIPNHTSSDHPWFVESRMSTDSPKRDWYVWHNPSSNGGPPNNWIGRFGGSAWEYDEKTEQYYLHQFLPEQPELNWRNKDVRVAMQDILRFWLDRGIDGFRTDAINHLVEDESFEDEPPNPNYVPGRDDPYDEFLHIQMHGRPETLFTANVFCRVFGEYQDKVMLGESYLNIEDMLKFYGACPNQTVVPMNFNLLTLPWSASDYRIFIDSFERALRPEYWPTYVAGNHDHSRILSRLGEARARLMAILLFTLRGTPFVYYGDEIGMKDISVDPEQAFDVWEKQVPGLRLGRDPERSPMRWARGKNAGFTKGEPWLPIGDGHTTCNVEDESDDPHSMLSLYRFLIHLRNSFSALTLGSYSSLDINTSDVLAYQRESAGKKFLVVLNFTEEEHVATVPGGGRGEIICSTHLNKNGQEIDMGMIPLKPHEGFVVDCSPVDN